MSTDSKKKSAIKARGFGLTLAFIGPDLRSVHHWLQMAETLERSYRAVLREVMKGNKRIKEISQGGFAGEEFRGARKRALSVALQKTSMMRPAIMLAAMAIECHLKAIISLSEDPPMAGHNLAAMAKKAGFPMQTDDKALLDKSLQNDPAGPLSSS